MSLDSNELRRLGLVRNALASESSTDGTAKQLFDAFNVSRWTPKGREAFLSACASVEAGKAFAAEAGKRVTPSCICKASRPGLNAPLVNCKCDL